MVFQKLNINDLHPAEYNPHKDLKPADSKYQKIKRSIEEFGYVDPEIVNSDMMVIGGHQRIKVLKDLGYHSMRTGCRFRLCFTGDSHSKRRSNSYYHIVNNPTVAMIGEAGAEAVVPLQNSGFVETMAKAVASAVQSSGKTGSDGDINLTMQIDGNVFGKLCVKAINGQTRKLGLHKHHIKFISVYS